MDIVRSARTLIHKGAFVARRYAPEILTAAGVGGVLTAGVLGAKSTLKLERTLSDAEIRLEDARRLREAEGGGTHVVRAYLKNTSEIGKLYAGPVTLALASVAAILAAHGIMRRRNAALVAAYGVLESAFSNYRERVREALGEEREQELYYGVTEKTVVQESTGKKTKVKSIDGNSLSPYAVIFDEHNRYWEPETGTNKTFLLIKQQHFNDMLQMRGHLFLNDVYKGLGFPETRAGQIVGWRSDTENGDGYVDLGIFIPESDVKRDFINGIEPNVWLNPNVDGPILDFLPEFRA